MRPTKPIHDLNAYPKKYLSPMQLANYIGVTRRTIYHHIEKGALRAVHRLGVVRIHVDEARRYLELDAAPQDR